MKNGLFNKFGTGVYVHTIPLFHCLLKKDTSVFIVCPYVHICMQSRQRRKTKTLSSSTLQLLYKDFGVLLHFSIKKIILYAFSMIFTNVLRMHVPTYNIKKPLFEPVLSLHILFVRFTE